MSRKRWATTYLTAALLAIGTVAQAQEPADQAPPRSVRPDGATYEELTRRAEEKFQRGDHDAAVDLLTQAHELRPHPNTLYNIARVYEDKGDLTTAIEYFDRFLVAPGVSLSHRREALERRRTLSEIMQVQGTAPTSNTTRTGTTALPMPTAQAEQPLSEPIGVSESKVNPTRTLGTILTAGGGVALVSGGVFGVLALTSQAEFNRTSDLELARSSARQASSYARVSDVLMITGASLGVTGLILWVTSGLGSPADDRRTETRSDIDVTATADGFATTWTLKF